jgi:7-keto-8-aminopelargonate synthetase-like enzyme
LALGKRSAGLEGGSYDTIDQVIADGVSRGVGHLSTEDARLDGRVVHVRGKRYLNFGTSSYLALEHHPALVAGARDALERYGTQFSSSRTYLQLGLYDELEASLEQIFGSPVLATASTTLGHMSALPVLVQDGDAVILDQRVHSSIQMVCQILKARGVPLIVIRHNRMDQLEDRIHRLRNAHERIWYMADGVYSMLGNGAPVEALSGLMDRYPQLRVYLDDAHGFGWDGPHGCGYVRARMPHHPQLLLAVSMNKSYASAGGRPRLRQRARQAACPKLRSYLGL